MEYRALYRYCDVAPRKIRPFATLIRGRMADEALELLRHVGFVNAYGLTETSSTIALLGPEEHRAAHRDPGAGGGARAAGQVPRSGRPEISRTRARRARRLPRHQGPRAAGTRAAHPALPHPDAPEIPGLVESGPEPD